jgi:hypothetical protein
LSATPQLKQFQGKLYSVFEAYTDTLLAVMDALPSHTSALSVLGRM